MPAEQGADDLDWRVKAKCAGHDPELFFAPGSHHYKRAKKICRRCPVKRQCLLYAMETPVNHGVWGGLTEHERRRYRRSGAQDWRWLLA